MAELFVLMDMALALGAWSGDPGTEAGLGCCAQGSLGQIAGSWAVGSWGVVLRGLHHDTYQCPNLAGLKFPAYLWQKP